MRRIEKAHSKQDFNVIEALAIEIWKEHYTQIIGEKQVAYMLDKFQSANAMKKQVADGVEYFLIYLDNKAVGYFSIAVKSKALFLSKLYVLFNHRGKGLAKFALQFIQNQLKPKACDYISLTVNKYNTASILAYEKLGFQKTDAIVVDIGGGFVMDDFVMEMR